MDGSNHTHKSGNRFPPSFSVRNQYPTMDRFEIMEAFRQWHAETEYLLEDRLSAADIYDMIDEAFFRYHDWMSETHSANFKSVFNDRLDPKTIRELLNCELSYKRVRRFHDNSLRVVDAFLQIMKSDPLPYLRPPSNIPSIRP